jgi:hypothetical protein
VGDEAAGEEEKRNDATREVTWSRAPSQSGRDPADPVKSFDISTVISLDLSE